MAFSSRSPFSLNTLMTNYALVNTQGPKFSLI